ncbi:MAG: polyphosphate kinase 2 [Alphaproteobacteria bacterium]|nr:polyphosphate kinase 2 [Alphaproteobacteria bacterium]MDX5369316.1 polyphosphate kinase 2 [Alphaproteobacteria bacterium]MDX5464001.1 polyphosphate kinase 2 [Alphaproteobacteria bacterium]
MARPGLTAEDIDTLEELRAPLPKEVEEQALSAGGYPYDDKMSRKAYDKALYKLQVELAKLQDHVQHTGQRIVAVFEGRDAAGKGGTIKRFAEYLNPRHARTVALPKPTEREQGEWYFQRYVRHLPTRGEICLFDRSWYNRAGVERVFGFCTEAEVERFFDEVPDFEAMLARDGVILFKFWLTIGRETQIVRFHKRATDPLKRWKLSTIDIAALKKWDAYTDAISDMMEHTDTARAPWTVIMANDKRRARINALRHFLSHLDYEDKDPKAVGAPDPKIVLGGRALV